MIALGKNEMSSLTEHELLLSCFVAKLHGPLAAKYDNCL